jgi:putative sigma-54 modulation protein
MMSVTVTGRHLDISPAARRQINSKIERLQRVLNGGAQSAQCVLTRERLGVACELAVRVRGDRTLVGVGRHARLETAVNLAVEKVSQQAHRLADRRKTHLRDTVRAADGLPADADGAGAADSAPKVIRARGYVVRAMTIDDAVIALQAARQPVLVFRHVDTDVVSVLFERPDGKLGLINAGS